MHISWSANILETLIETIIVDKSRRSAYFKFFDLVESGLKVALFNNLGKSNFLITVDHYILRGSPAIKILATGDDNTGAVFVCFDSELDVYAVGQTTMGRSDGLFGTNCRDAAMAELTRQLTDMVKRWP